MKEYEVKIEYVGIETLYVDAENKEEAKKLALEESRMRAEGAEVSIYEITKLK